MYHRRRFDPITVIALIVLIGGLCAMIYPVVATAWNNHLLHETTATYRELQREVPKEELHKDIEEARRWNRENESGQILDPWTSTASRHSEGYKSYLRQLSRSDVIAQVVIPKINVNLPVRHGSSDITLQRGLGHLYGTGLPVGGLGTHSSITGHTGMRNATMFDRLSELTVGDTFFISTYGENMKYRVFRVDVVLPEETSLLSPIPGKDIVTLITCTPYGVNSHRLLVTAERVPLDPHEEHVFEEPGSIFEKWMIWVGLGALCIIALIVWSTMYARKRQKQRKNYV